MRHIYQSQLIKRGLTLLVVFSLLISISPPLKVEAGEIPNTSEMCADVVLLFTRGSGQNRYKEQVDDPLNPSFKSLEKESYTFFNWHAQRFKDDYPNITYKAISVHDFPGKYDNVGYNAVGVGYSSLDKVSNSANADASWFPGDYRDSVKQGTAETIGFLKDQIQQCPDQYYVVGGYSQGAQVMGDTLFQLTEPEKAKILGVGFFGDPKYIGHKDGVSLPWRRGEASDKDRGMLEARIPYIPDELERRTVSWCSRNDMVCAGWSAFRKQSSHSSYSDTAISHAVNELTRIAAPQLMALDRKRVTGSGEIPTTRISKADRDRQRDVMFLVNDNSNESVLRTFKFQLDPMLPTFTSGFTGTRYGAKAFAENDWGGTTGNVPRYTHIQALTPLVGFDPSKPSSTGSNLVKSFNTKYKGVPFIAGGGDVSDPYQVAIERTVAGGGWRTDPEVERNIVMIVDRPPKDPYQYNICHTTLRSSLKYPDVNSYKNCFTDPIEESWPSDDFPEACATVLIAMTEPQCTKPLTTPTQSHIIKRSNNEALKIAQANRVKVSIVIPHKITDPNHPLNSQLVQTQMKALAEATGGIFINYSDKDLYSPAVLQDTLYQVFTKQPRALNAVIDGVQTGKVTTFAVNMPVILDVSREPVGAETYQWDFNNDGAWDTISQGPVIEHSFKDQVAANMTTVQALDANGSVLGETVFAYDVELASAQEPSSPPQPPEILSAAVGADNDTRISWQPTADNHDVLIIDPESKLIIGTAMDSDGSITVPGAYTELAIRAVDDESVSEEAVINVEPYVAPVVQPESSNTVQLNQQCTDIQGCGSTPPVQIDNPAAILTTNAVGAYTPDEHVSQNLNDQPVVAGLVDVNNSDAPAFANIPQQKSKNWLLFGILLLVIVVGLFVARRINRSLSTR